MSNESDRPQSLLVMCGLAVAVGVIAGLGAWVFRRLIGLFHDLMFLGEFSFAYDANTHTPPSPWGAGVILVPVVGAVAVVWLVKTFAPEAKGHGVPEVIDAIYYQGAHIRPIVAVIKSVASAICIGSGGSVGREGPIIQIGSAFGSTLGQIVNLPARQRVTLIAAGAGGGIAATFNAPLGGVVFAIELLLVSINARNILPVGIATTTACFIGRAMLGSTPSFDFPPLQVPDFHLTAPHLLLLFVPFGLLMGLVSLLFVRGIYWAEDRFDALPVNDYVRHMGGMAVVGVMIYLLHRTTSTGYYYVQGVGYATIMDVLMEKLTDPGFLLLLFALKFVATCLTLGSGGSGGVFSPALFLGATAGSVFAQAVQALMPGIDISPVAFVIAGMAAAIGGSTGAILTGSVMLTEMTADINVMIPIIITSTIAYGVRRWISPESIYTLKLARRGHVVPQGMQAALLESMRAETVMETEFRVIRSDEAGELDSGPALVAEGEQIMGFAGATGIAAQTGPLPYHDRFVVVPRERPLAEVLREMRAAGAVCAVVVESEEGQQASDVVGVVTEREIAAACHKAAELL